MSTARAYFDEAMALTDPIDRAEEICDFAFDATNLAAAGNRAEAIEMFKLLLTLDRYDDLLLPAIEIAEENLVALGVRKLPNLDDAVNELHKKFRHLGDAQRLIAVAKTLVREHGRKQPAAWRVARDLLAESEKIQPLGNKDLRYKAEVAAKIASGV